MVKKSIIAIALMCMLATVSYGQDSEWHSGGQLKIDPCPWPATITITYTPLEICRIPIYIKVGMFIEVENCSQKKIILEQVSCPGGKPFPCYKGCVAIRVRANFEAKLTLKLYKIGDVISGYGNGNWKAYFTGEATTFIVSGDGNWNNVDICVEAWDVNIYGLEPCKQTKDPIGEVSILAIPTATPDYCDYCP